MRDLGWLGKIGTMGLYLADLNVILPVPALLGIGGGVNPREVSEIVSEMGLIVVTAPVFVNAKTCKRASLGTAEIRMAPGVT